MNSNTIKRLNQINFENEIWIVYLIIIALSYYSNYLEKDYFINNNQKSKETYRKINTLIFTALVLIYTYFEKDSLTSYINNKNKNNTLILTATTLVLISGIIFLYIILEDTNLETEIAFN